MPVLSGPRAAPTIQTVPVRRLVQFVLVAYACTGVPWWILVAIGSDVTRWWSRSGSRLAESSRFCRRSCCTFGDLSALGVSVSTGLGEGGGVTGFAAVTLLAGPLAEGFGWRGYLQPGVRTRRGVFRTVAWSVWSGRSGICRSSSSPAPLSSPGPDQRSGFVSARFADPVQPGAAVLDRAATGRGAGLDRRSVRRQRGGQSDARRRRHRRFAERARRVGGRRSCRGDLSARWCASPRAGWSRQVRLTLLERAR